MTAGNAASGRNPLEIAAQVVELARRAGAGACDAFVTNVDESTVSVRLGEVEKLIEAGSCSVGLRVISGGRTAVCSSSDIRPEALADLARSAVELAAISEPDEFAGLPSAAELAATLPGGLSLFDEELAGLSVARKIEMALACEGAAFAADPRISNSDGATLSSRSGEIALANSLGFARSYAATSVSVSVEVMADDADGKKRNAWWYDSQRSLQRLLDPTEVGRIAARRAVAQLGARKVETRRVPVIFEPMMAAALAGHFAGSASGSSLYRQTTFLAGREGERIGATSLTIRDDPLAPGRSATRPFDGEGVPVRRMALMEAGRFTGFFHDVYTARRCSAATTGSAHRGIQSLPSPGSSNLILEAGHRDPAEIIAEVDEGLYVTSLMGQGYSASTGDFSRGAAGFWISKGEIAFPVTEVNISGNLGKMLHDVDALGSDLTWFGSSAAPTLRVSEMTVSGT